MLRFDFVQQTIPPSIDHPWSMNYYTATINNTDVCFYIFSHSEYSQGEKWITGNVMLTLGTCLLVKYFRDFFPRCFRIQKSSLFNIFIQISNTQQWRKKNNKKSKLNRIHHKWSIWEPFLWLYRDVALAWGPRCSPQNDLWPIFIKIKLIQILPPEIHF